MWTIRWLFITFVLVFDPVAEGICGAAELPGEDVGGLIRVGDDGRVLPVCPGAGRSWRSVDADESVLAPHFPEVPSVVMVLDAREQPLAARAVAACPPRLLGHPDEVFCTRKDERVLV